MSVAPTIDQGPDLAERPGRIRRPSTATARALVLVLVTVIADRYSLQTLMRSLGVDSPLAYLGLVPPIALGLGIVYSRPRAGEPTVYDRHFDRIVAVPLLAVMVAVSVFLPARLSSFYWLWRIDLLVLPLFVAGAVALLFGTRTLFRTRVPILFLFLAWPVPFRWILTSWLERFTTLTIGAVTKFTQLIPIASPVHNGTEGEFVVKGPAEDIHIVVASVCSGANSLLGWLLVGSAIALVSSGRRARKLQWLAVGAVVVWTVNVLRILLVFVAASMWGEDFAFDVLHPYIGLVLFIGAVLFMLAVVAPRMGVALGSATSDRSSGPRRTVSDDAAAAVPRWRTAACGLLVLSVFLGVVDGRLVEVDPVASALGAPKLINFRDSLHREVGGLVRRTTDRFDWAKRFFGDDSDWTRYQFVGTGVDGLHTDVPVTADVVTTSELQTFDDFGVEACYRFHGYEVADIEEFELGHGLIGTMLSWEDPGTQLTWTSVYWYWPIAVGDETQYQRMVLMVNTAASARFGYPPLDLAAPLDGSVEGGDARGFLVSFARLVVQTASGQEATDVD